MAAMDSDRTAILKASACYRDVRMGWVFRTEVQRTLDLHQKYRISKAFHEQFLPPGQHFNLENAVEPRRRDERNGFYRAYCRFVCSPVG